MGGKTSRARPLGFWAHGAWEPGGCLLPAQVSLPSVLKPHPHPPGGLNAAKGTREGSGACFAKRLCPQPSPSQSRVWLGWGSQGRVDAAGEETASSQAGDHREELRAGTSGKSAFCC